MLCSSQRSVAGCIFYKMWLCVYVHVCCMWPCVTDLWHISFSITHQNVEFITIKLTLNRMFKKYSTYCIVYIHKLPVQIDTIIFIHYAYVIHLYSNTLNYTFTMHSNFDMIHTLFIMQYTYPLYLYLTLYMHYIFIISHYSVCILYAHIPCLTLYTKHTLCIYSYSGSINTL